MTAPGRVSDAAHRFAVRSHAPRELGKLPELTVLRRRHFHRRLSDTNLFGILFWTSDGEITGANDAFLGMLGYSRDDFACGLKWASLTPQEYRERDRAAFAQVVERGATAPYEKEFFHRNGHRVRVLVGLAAFDDEPGKGASYVLDTSRYQRRVDEQRILADMSQRALQDDLAPFLHFTADAIQDVLHSDGCRIVLRGREELTVSTGYCPSSATGDADSEPGAHVALAITGGEPPGILEVFGPAAETCAAEEETFLQAAANVISAVVNHRRTSEALAVKEQQAAERLRLESLGRLAGGIAHDFNNLLTAILGYADLAAASHPDDRSDLDEICRAANSAAELVRQLLAFSGRQRLQTRRIDLCAATSALERMLRRLIGERINFICNVPAEPLFVAGDPAQIEQVVMNLVLNARDAIKEDGTIVLSLAATHISEPDADMSPGLGPGEYATLTITDTGEGMDEQTRIRIFEPFFTTKGLGKGTGLGLATVHGVVQQSGGAISVQSERHHGSVFTVHLPLADRPDRHASAVADLRVQGKETVLLVDDDAAVRGALARALPRFGYRVIPAATPKEAIAIAASRKRRIHALVTDVVMPSMSGTALAERIREVVPGIHTLFISGYPERALLETGAGPDHVLNKPFTCQQLAGRLRDILDHDNTPSAASPIDRRESRR